LYPDEKSFQALTAALKSTSHRNKVAASAINAMRAQNNAKYTPILLESLKADERNYPARSFGKALEALAFLARDEEKKADIRDFLLEQTSSLKRSVRVSAMNALGVLGDAQAIAPLEKLALSSTQDPTEAGPARRALEALRAGRKTGDEVQSIRTEMLDLKRQNSELEKQLKEITKKLDAVKPAIKTEPEENGAKNK
jgi:HEAT repeat protein